jgi:hypothetical protein
LGRQHTSNRAESSICATYNTHNNRATTHHAHDFTEFIVMQFGQAETVADDLTINAASEKVAEKSVPKFREHRVPFFFLSFFFLVGFCFFLGWFRFVCPSSHNTACGLPPPQINFVGDVAFDESHPL